MKDNRIVNIAFTSKKALFTQRGKNKDRGFIRMNGLTITGYRIGNEFFTSLSGINNNVPYQGDSLSW